MKPLCVSAIIVALSLYPRQGGAGSKNLYSLAPAQRVAHIEKQARKHGIPLKRVPMPAGHEQIHLNVVGQPAHDAINNVFGKGAGVLELSYVNNHLRMIHNNLLYHFTSPDNQHWLMTFWSGKDKPRDKRVVGRSAYRSALIALPPEGSEKLHRAAHQAIKIAVQLKDTNLQQASMQTLQMLQQEGLLQAFGNCITNVMQLRIGENNSTLAEHCGVPDGTAGEAIVPAGNQNVIGLCFYNQADPSFNQ